MPAAFLAEVLEWNETIEEARDAEPDSAERAALEELENELRSQREEVMAAIESKLDPLPDAHAPILTEVRLHLNAIRYVDRSLREIAEIRLAEASNA